MSGKRRLVPFVLILSMFISVMPYDESSITATAASQDSSEIVYTDEESSLEYKICDGEIHITGLSKKVTDIVIPDKIDGKEVTSVDDNAFKDNLAIKTFSSGNNVRSIGQGAFSECSSLTDINLNEGIEKLGYACFSGCNSLKDFKMPETVKIISNYCFYGCSSLTNVSFPVSVDAIYCGALQNTSIESLKIPFCGQTRDASGWQSVLGYIFGYTTKANNRYEGRPDSPDETTYQESEEIKDTSYDRYYYYYIPKTLKTLEITDDKTVNKQDLMNCSMIEQLIIDENTTKAYITCEGIKELYLPDSLIDLTLPEKNAESLTIYTSKNTAGCAYAKKNSLTCITTRDIRLDKSNIVLKRGESETLVPKVIMYDGLDDEDPDIEWSSSDAGVAEVDSSGKVTEVSPGRAVITAKCDDKTAECIVTVHHILEGINFKENKIEIDLNDSCELPLIFEPADTDDDKTVIWSSEDKNTASVSQLGTVTAVSGGSVMINAESIKGYKAKVKVKVLIPAKHLEISGLPDVMKKGSSVKGILNILPVDTTDTWKWKSDDTDVLKTDNAGNITAVNSGTAEITVETSRGLKVSKSINVITPAENISLPSERNIFIDDPLTLSAVLFPRDTTDSVKWSSDSPECVCAFPEGIFRIAASGTAVITAVTDSGKKASCTVNVNNDIANAGIKIIDSEFHYTGSEVRPDIIVTYGNKTFEENKDYIIEYRDNVQPGIACLTVKGIGRYSGSASENFIIHENDISDKESADISLPAYSYQYTGTEIRPSVTMTYNGKLLTEGIDFDTEYFNCENQGTAQVLVTGRGIYTGSRKIIYTIKPNVITDVSLKNTDMEYTGEEKKADIVVKFDGTVLTEGKDYYVTYRNNVNAGTAYADITGRGIYTGSVTRSFNVKRKDISELSAEGVYDSYVYTGKEIYPEPVIKYNNYRLKKGVDYSIDYGDNVDHGYGELFINGTGNFEGSVRRIFTIEPKEIDKSMISADISDEEYSGIEIEKKVNVTDGGKELISGKDYKITYKDNLSIGKATVIVNGLGNYSGNVHYYFEIRAVYTPAPVMPETHTPKITESPISKNPETISPVTSETAAPAEIPEKTTEIPKITISPVNTASPNSGPDESEEPYKEKDISEPVKINTFVPGKASPSPDIDEFLLPASDSDVTSDTMSYGDERFKTDENSSNDSEISAGTIKLNRTFLFLNVNDSFLLDVDTDLADDPKFSSEDEDVAEVDEFGFVEAVKAGNTVINVVCGSLKVSCYVIVSDDKNFNIDTDNEENEESRFGEKRVRLKYSLVRKRLKAAARTDKNSFKFKDIENGKRCKLVSYSSGIDFEEDQLIKKGYDMKSLVVNEITLSRKKRRSVLKYRVYAELCEVDLNSNVSVHAEKLEFFNDNQLNKILFKPEETFYDSVNRSPDFYYSVSKAYGTLSTSDNYMPQNIRKYKNMISRKKCYFRYKCKNGASAKYSIHSRIVKMWQKELRLYQAICRQR